VSISTHVLDATTGQPARGLEVMLSRREGDTWQPLGQRVTDAGGRVRDLAPEAAAGVYRIVFQTGGYLGEAAFYPEVVVIFRITDPGAHHHVPLLLSPFAYSTYRGS
jgi:5-hydroxyisourate hydrolase